MACKKRATRAYEKALAKGVLLVPDDTVTARVGDPVMLPYRFADGVQPIHYTLAIVNSDTQALPYQSNPEFHFAPPDMSGGPAAGIHVFEAKQPALVKLVFYNPYYNEAYYQKANTTDSYDIWLALAQAVGTPDTAYFNREVWQQWYYSLQTALPEVRDSFWVDMDIATGMAPEDTIPDVDSLLTALIPLVYATDPVWNAAVVEHLLQRYAPSRLPFWQQQWEAFRRRPPLHPDLEQKVCYVRIV